jgi:glutaredoxin
MDFEEPTSNNFTIYSKSGCILCSKVKDLLTKNNLDFSVIDCDEYLIEDRQGFLLFINSCAKKDTAGFPKVFRDGEFVGSYKETKDLVEKILNFEENGDF